MEEENKKEKLSIMQVKYEKTSCYFCNEWLDSQTFKEHIIHCGQVLEKCPNLCSVYVTRKKMRSHLKECPKLDKNNSITNNNYDFENDNKYKITEYENRLLILEQDITSLRSVLNEEIKQRLHLITDVGSLRKHNQISDEWTQKVGDVLTTLKKCINEESASRSNFITRCNEDIGKLNYQLQVLLDWKCTTNTRLDQIIDRIIKQESDSTNITTEFKEKDTFVGDSIHKMQLEIASLQDQISKLSYDTTKMCTRLTDDVIRIQKVTDDSERFIRSKFNAFESTIQNLNAKCFTDTNLNTKQMTLDYDVKSIKSIVYETEEKCDKLETIIMDIDRTIHQTHQDLANIEMALYKKKIIQIENTKGHLIWKITNYANKMNEARQFDAVLRSPIFTNKQYGYLLRLEVCLNGIGTWKNRNIIACLTVLPGEYDTLLQWPCKLQADIILRDQTSNLLDAQDYIKTTIVKRKNDEFQNTNQFIHIPHKILENRHYIRNDTIFFEVHVHKIRRTSQT